MMSQQVKRASLTLVRLPVILQTQEGTKEDMDAPKRRVLVPGLLSFSGKRAGLCSISGCSLKSWTLQAVSAKEGMLITANLCH